MDCESTCRLKILRMAFCVLDISTASMNEPSARTSFDYIYGERERKMLSWLDCEDCNSCIVGSVMKIRSEHQMKVQREERLYHWIISF